MQITLLRHGKPEFEFTGKVTAAQLRQLIKSYDSAGITNGPPACAVNQAQKCNIVVCSHLPRSIQSAKAIGLTEINISDAIYSEAGLPYAAWTLVKLPVKVWAIFFRMLWCLGYSNNEESIFEARQRAKKAANHLMSIARQHDSVIFVGHGFINRFIAKELLLNGWVGPKNPGKNYWEFGVYHYQA